LVVFVLSPDCLGRKLGLGDFFQALRCRSRAWGEAVRAVPRLCIEYPGICLATEENHGNPQSG